MNPLALRSQVNGGIIQGISYALYEDRVDRTEWPTEETAPLVMSCTRDDLAVTAVHEFGLDDFPTSPIFVPRDPRDPGVVLREQDRLGAAGRRLARSLRLRRRGVARAREVDLELRAFAGLAVDDVTRPDLLDPVAGGHQTDVRLGIRADYTRFEGDEDADAITLGGQVNF